ncbi:MAG: PAS domain S-box protein [candidate division Zixibacteria bacterium]|nr:PAS domain S-box protein [candidate division Zixibacteria bacterium]
MSGKTRQTTILIIDNEAAIRQSFADCLDDRDYRTLTAENGRIGLEIFAREKVDLVLVDLRMPEVDGLEVLARITATSPDTPLIVVSGTGVIGDAVEALHGGAWDYLLKPIEDLSVLIHAVETTLEKAQLKRENREYQQYLEFMVADRTEGLEETNKHLSQINTRLRRVVDTTRSLSYCTETKKLGALMLEEIGQHMLATGGSLYLKEKEGIRLVHTLDPGHAPRYIPFPLPNDSILKRAIEEEKPLLIQDVKKERNIKSSGWDGYHDGSVLAFPLADETGRVTGALTLHGKIQPPFIKQDVEIGAILTSYCSETLKAARSMETLRESEEKWQSLTDNTKDIIQILDTKGNILYMNRVYFPHEMKDVIGKSVLDFTLDEYKEVTQKSIDKLLAGKGPQTFETTIYLSESKVAQFEVKFVPMLTDGKVDKIISLVTDISEKRRSELALRESESELRAIYDNAPLIMLLVDRERRIVKLNGRAVSMARRPAEEVVGLFGGEALRCVNAIDDPKGCGYGPACETCTVRSTVLKTFQSGRAFHKLEAEFPYDHPDGRIDMHVLVSTTPLSTTEGNFVLVCLEDITERKLAEKALHQYEHIVSSSTDMLALLDKRFKYLAANKAYMDAFKLTPEELIGNTAVKVFGEEFFNSAIKPNADRCLDGKEVNYQNWFEFPITGRRYMDITYYPYYSEGKKIMGFVVNGRDITERKQAEKALEAERDYSTDIIQSLPGLFYVIRKDSGLLQSRNDSWASVTGYSEDELDRMMALDFFEEGSDRDKCAQRMREVYDKGWSSMENFIVTKDGRKLPYYFTGRKVVIDGRAYLAGLAIDISERKRVKEEKAHLEEQYHQAQKVESIGRLAGGISHDLNNLLSPILGYGEILLGNLGSAEKRQEYAGQIVLAAERARDLVRQLLAFGRRQTLEYKPVDMNRAVTSFKKLLRRTIREDIEIKIIPSPDIWTVMADIGQIEQVIMNLAVNAADAMPEGGCLTIEIAPTNLDEEYITIHQDVKPGPYVMLSISDTGCGMNDEVLEHMFEPFFSTKGELGTGLGLATVFGIVKQHGGNVWAYSEIGKGTTFKIYLPVSEKQLVKEKTPGKAIGSLRGTETILLVEDNDQVRQLALTILRRQGYEVLVAENGADALKTLESYDGPVHLLFTDVVMPEMNGRELYTKITNEYQGLKVLYMSGYTDNVIAHRGVLDEGIAFIQKPFTSQALAIKTREVLDTKD